jgi:hypothetical protein
MKPVETMLGSNKLQAYSEAQRMVIAGWGKTKQQSRYAACQQLAPPRSLPNDDICRYATAALVPAELNNFQAVSHGLDQMLGWHCFLSADKITVRSDGTVIPGDTCDQWPAFGNFLTSDPSSWDWRIYPQQCRRDRCVCGGDLDTHKFQDAAAAAEYAATITDLMDHK